MSNLIENGENTTGDERKLSEHSDTEYDGQFKPALNLPEVEVVTNEENEEIILKVRAKVYRYDSTCDPSEWKERGMGEMMMLHNTENNSVRIVMRRDKTFKVCANHFITPWMKLTACFGSDKAYLYTATDFADEKIVNQCLAVKFGNVDNAILFKKKFEEARETVATKCNLYNGQGDAENESASNSSSSDEDGEENECLEKLEQLNVNHDTNNK